MKNFFPVPITGNGLILNEGADQVVEWLTGNRILFRGATQRNEHRMLRFARIHAADFARPPLEQAKAFRGVADFVRQIVRPAAIRVDVVEILMQFSRQQKTDHVEIFVMVSGEPTRVLLRIGERPHAGHGFLIADKLARQERGHGMIAVLNDVPPSARRHVTRVWFSSDSSASTKSRARMPPLEMMSRASCMDVGVWWKLALQVMSVLCSWFV